MPKIKKYEAKIPAFYRRSALDLMLFTHVTALCERYNVNLDDAIIDFFDLYGISDNDFPIESALTTYNRVRNNFIWTKITEQKNFE